MADGEEGALSELGDKERRFVEDQRRVENFLGHEHRNCGEHRTVGPHRAWCYDCEEWCYPDAPCIRCEEPRKDALLAEAAEVLRAFVQEEPVGHGGVTDELYCVYCDGKQLGSPTWQFEHTKDCAWIRAKPLLDRLEANREKQ